MAGGEPRFGTTAIYMPTLLLQTSNSVKTKEAHISLVTCQHSASEDLNNVLLSRDFSGQPKRELQANRGPPTQKSSRNRRSSHTYRHLDGVLGSRRYSSSHIPSTNIFIGPYVL